MANSNKINILIVDDESVVRESLRSFLEKKGHNVSESDNAEAAMERLKYIEYDLIFLDIKMPGMNGMEFLSWLQRYKPEIEVVMITGHGNMDIVIQTLRLGASDFLKKPIRMEELLAALEKTQRLIELKQTERRLRGAIQSIQSKVYGAMNLETIFVGHSATTQKLRQMITKAGRSGCRSVLVTGETGTGKEVIAKALHMTTHGDRAPFIPVNCPALPANLVESELFGHLKGAFTGANANQLGAFELADGGTLFLDEIADLSPAIQAKLLRVLETRQIRKIGCPKPQQVDVNIIAATNCCLQELVQKKQFREDLFYRLNTFEIMIPPLRERPEDIIPLAHHFIRQYAQTHFPDNETTLTVSAQNKLLEYHYPGNARELRNIIERALIFAGNDSIEADDITFPASKKPKVQRQTVKPATPAPIDLDHDDEAGLIRNVLEEVKWNRTLAAQKLNISYDALRWRINKYNLS